ncbi:HlyD family type I secretion periplasmic adaptor subunit [Enterovirga aerilata]|uniref:Membrane fusion protein (MFP) family protein n=1 Tax=Enterovirga aerilata TaxID=2730920 RepID=A0A849IBX1_9HYPH|nr:HlyD family type I secretion periplasmic adaptor subunit [Enterovirga sp. DB1703]NNM73540.1 HlyD family type I secretion periplasmic adaptor subunit [Enterovirga sp. DB1703]
MDAPTTTTMQSVTRHLALMVGAVVLLCGAAIAGAAVELSGAIIAAGSLVVESSVKKVQHPTGGVVSELLVQNGRPVRAGELLMRLDATTAKANLDAVTKTVWELSARRARLEAERDGLEEVRMPEDLTATALQEPDLARILTGEARLFRLRRDALAGQKGQLREQIAQLREEISGLEEQSAAKAQELELVAREWQGVRELWQKQLVQITRVTALEREQARLKGERGRLVAAAAQARGKISETELQIIQLDQNHRSEVAAELAEIRAKLSTVVEQKVTAEDQLRRVDIRAPQAGIVHELAVHTPGGVVSAGEQIMLIVPNADSLVVDARIAPEDIDQVRPGQAAVLRFPGLNQRTTPELRGEVIRIGADITEDKRTGISFFLVRIALAPGEARKLGDVQLVPGMPVNVFIRTSERTILSYLLRPLTDQVRLVFRES